MHKIYVCLSTCVLFCLLACYITQAIVGNELNLKLSPPLNGSVTSFGSSLSGNVDVDNNGLNGEKK